MSGPMLRQAATAAIKTAEMQLLAERMRITDLMTPARTIMSDASIAKLVPLLTGTRPGQEYQQLPIAVLDIAETTGDEMLVGIIDFAALSGVPRSSWHLPAHAVSRAMDQAAQTGASDSLENLFTNVR